MMGSVFIYYLSMLMLHISVIHNKPSVKNKEIVGTCSCTKHRPIPRSVPSYHPPRKSRKKNLCLIYLTCNCTRYDIERL